MPSTRRYLELCENAPEQMKFGGSHSAVVLRPCRLSRAVFIRSLLSRAEVTELLEISRRLSYSEQPDSVDGRPAHELYAIERGQAQHPELCFLLRPVIHHRVLPAVRRYLGIEPLAICTALLRRYQPGARRLHPAHFDAHALATVVVSLSEASAYEGGLYVQSSAHFPDRLFVPLARGTSLHSSTCCSPVCTGDAFAHTFDLRQTHVILFNHDHPCVQAWGQHNQRRAAQPHLLDQRVSALVHQ